MRVIPVLDLLHGLVVRGVAGQRSEYRPVESVLCSTSNAADVASAFRERLHLKTAYIADLDAILGGEPNWAAYRSIAEAGLELLVDAGLQNAAQTRVLLDFFSHATERGQGSLIAGLESVRSPRLLSEMLAMAGPERFIFSLDLKAGQPLTTSPDWAEHNAQQILSVALGLGVERFILLDLSRVGVGTGVGTESLCQFLREQAPTAEIIAGGGVRGVEDLRHLAACSCDGVLVASSLHDGRLDRAALAEFCN